MTPQELAAAGAELIRRNGWWDGRPHSDTAVNYCAWSCLDNARTRMFGAVDCFEALDQATEMIARYVGWNPIDSAPDGAFDFVTHWNDEPGRTEDEVLAVLDAVAAA